MLTKMSCIYHKLPGHLVAVLAILLGPASVFLRASILVQISGTLDGVSFQVNGSLLPSSLTEDIPWFSPIVQPTWLSDSGTNDYLSAGETLAYRQLLSNPSDTGILAMDCNYFDAEAIISGNGFSIGTTPVAESTGLVLERGFAGTTVDYSVYFPGATLADFCLSDGDSRQLSFDDNLGGRESITWSVTLIPEPATILIPIIVLGTVVVLGTRRERPRHLGNIGTGT